MDSSLDPQPYVWPWTHARVYRPVFKHLFLFQPRPEYEQDESKYL